MGGPLRVAEVTGSRAYERFTGNQVWMVAERMMMMMMITTISPAL
jgi:hypothetical protein